METNRWGRDPGWHIPHMGALYGTARPQGCGEWLVAPMGRRDADRGQGSRLGSPRGKWFVQPWSWDCGAPCECSCLLLAAASCPLGEGAQPTHELEPGASAAVLALGPPRQGQPGGGLLMLLEVLSLGSESVSSERQEEDLKHNVRS